MGTRAGLRLAADIGGTFTDVAVFDDTSGALAFGKVLSTPSRLVEGITAAVRKARTDYATAGVFLHGSTIAVNTILERTGARTALVTTEGFRDVYEIGRINRPDAYNLFFRKHEPLVERALCFEVSERTNDSYITGSHLNHVTLTLPIFHLGTLVGFACCMGHWQDIGGVLGGMTTDIFSEGLQIPIVKYQRAGVVNQDLVDIIRSNVRVPTRALGDLRAQVTAVRTGERRFLQLLDRYGQAPVLDAIAAIMDQSEAAARARTRTIPDGVYEAESYMDDDGVEIGTPIPIRVRVTVAGDAMTVDLSDVARQVRGFYNSGITTGHACAQVAYKCLTSPTDYPINDGSFRSLTAIVPPGRVVSATRPAPMRWWMTFPMTIVDTVFKALAPAIPDRVIAGHHADLLAAQVHGIEPRTKEFFIGGFGPLGGGWGAKQAEDGVSATVCINDGDTHNSPNEQVEAKYPLLVERFALVPDSGGAGRHRGGLGIERVVRAQTALTFNTQIERAHCRPWGLDGGLEGTGNRVALRLGGQWKTEFPNAKLLVVGLERGDAFRVTSGGGGGYGAPQERPADTVREDVKQGYVSGEAAADLYGVVIDPVTFEIDRAATERRRATRSISGA